MASPLDLTANWIAVQDKIARACGRAGRNPGEITVIAVTKTHPMDLVRKACALGIQHIGENRVQEVIEKYGNSDIHHEYPDARLHLIGHLQRNKARKALQIFDNIDSLDSQGLAEMLDAEAERLAKRVRVLLEVNTSNEPQKFGIEPGAVADLADFTLKCRNLQLAGLMTVGPNTDDQARIRQSFRLLKEIFVRIADRWHPENWSVLSMGMSGDYEIAIEEGATELRLGTALFGPRTR